MKKKFVLSILAMISLSFAAYFTACKKDNVPEQDDPPIKPISVSFSREAILGLLANAGANEVAGICLIPVQDGDAINLQAILAEWNTSEGKPEEMIKVMSKTVTGTLTTDPCPALTANGTTEFEFAFCDKAMLTRFLDEEHYYPDATQKPDGLYFSRIMLDLNDNVEFKKYRGLLLKPYPLPNLENGFSERAGVGYIVIPTCPPYWRVE